MVIKASGLGKDFNFHRIFTNFTYSLETGNSYAITGPNGSGKSTLLMTLSGFINPSKGELNYYNQDIRIDPEQWYKFIVIVTPYLQLIEEFTLNEFLKFHFKFKSIQEDISLDQIPLKCGLEGHEDTLIKHFSSGMKQRLKLGIGFYSQCPILLFDEPTTNLDYSGMDWYKKEINAIKSNKLVVIASNQSNEHDFCQNTIDLSNLK